MAKMAQKTIEKDEAYLRQVSQEVDFNDTSLSDDAKALADFCRGTNYFALAAIQIGIPKRIVYLKNTSPDYEDKNHDEAKVLVNPRIISCSGLTKYWEACVSCLNNTGLVARPYRIEIEYFELDGSRKTEVFEGFASTVISHELDHLDGILHMDIAEEVLQMDADERKEFRKTHPYEIIRKTGDYKKNLKIKTEVG